MNAGWIDLVPAFLAAAGWIVLPGVAMLYAIGARGLVAWGIGPAASIASIASLAIVLERVGLPWNPWTVGAGLAVVALLVAVLMRLFRRAPSARARDHGARHVVIAWAIAGAICAGVFAWALVHPAAISQTFDNGFHMNAVRHILDTADGSTLTISRVVDSSGVYPAAWHDLVSLVVESSGASIPVGLNATNLAVLALAWPGAVLVLARTVFGGNPAATYSAAIIGSLLPWFPMLMLTFGVLYPFFLALALLPVALALQFSLLGTGSALGLSRPRRIVLLLVVWLAIALAQPAIVFAAIAVAIPAAVGVVVRRVLRSPETPLGRRVVLGGVALVALVVFVIAWVVVGRMGQYAPWEPIVGPRAGVVQAALLFRYGAPASIGVALLAVLGLVFALVRRRRLPLVGMWAVGAVLYYVADSIGQPFVRNTLLGLFYKDPPRLAALFAVTCIPLATYGAVTLWRLIGHRVRMPQVRAVIAVAALAALVATQVPAMRTARNSAANAFRMTEDAPIITNSERRLIERLPDETGLEGVLVGNPWTGTNLAYALADQEVLNPHFNSPKSPEQILINNELRNAASDPEVCAAVSDLDVRWVLDFGDFIRNDEKKLTVDSRVGMEGLLDLGEAPGFEEVDREGGLVLYRITACD